MKLQFEEVFCINLDRRPDRWQKFVETIPTDWPFGRIERVGAIDGRLCHAPNWWSVGDYAWACYRSHLNVIEQCLNRGIKSCLILEDDAICRENFAPKWRSFEQELPEDWQMIYLGGQHLDTNRHPPLRLSENVYVPFDVNRCHAYGIRGKESFDWIYRHLNETQGWMQGHHIDHHLGRAHQRRDKPIYCPSEWLIGQNEGMSDICWKDCDVRFFPPAKSYLPTGCPFTIVLGSTWNSIQKIVRVLSSHGFLIANEILNQNSFTHQLLTDVYPLLNEMMTNSFFTVPWWIGKLLGKLSEVFRSCLFYASQSGKRPAAFHPGFCRIAHLLESMFGRQLRVINMTADPGKRTPQAKALEDAKQEFVSSTNSPVAHVRVDDSEDRIIQKVSRMIQS